MQSSIRRFVTKLPAKAQKRKETRKGMQFTREILSAVCRVVAVLCLAAITAEANGTQSVTIKMSLPGDVQIEAQSSTPANSWSFRNAYAGVLGIAERINDFHATTASGQDAGVKKIATGEFCSALHATKISYRVNVSKPTAADVSHVSWIAGDYGLLMLADLLPRDFASVSIRFELPEGWGVDGSNSADADLHQVIAPEKAIFLVGRSFGNAQGSVGNTSVTTVVGGSWPFKERDALSSATKVMKSYQELTGYQWSGGVLIMIVPLPVKIGNLSLIHI